MQTAERLYILVIGLFAAGMTIGCADVGSGVPVASSPPPTFRGEPAVDSGDWSRRTRPLSTEGQIVSVHVSAECDDFDLVLTGATARAFSVGSCTNGTVNLEVRDASALVDRSGLVTLAVDLPVPTAVWRQKALAEARAASSSVARSCVGYARPYLLGAGNDVTYLTPGRFELRPLDPFASEVGSLAGVEYRKNPHTDAVKGTALDAVRAVATPANVDGRAQWKLTASSTGAHVATFYEVVDSTTGRAVVTDRAILSCDGDIEPAEVPLVVFNESYPIYAHFDACTSSAISSCVVRAAPDHAVLATQVYIPRKHSSGSAEQDWSVSIPKDGARLGAPPFLPATFWVGLGLMGAGAIELPIGLAESNSTAATVTSIAVGASLFVIGDVLVCLGPASVTRTPSVQPLTPRFAFGAAPTRGGVAGAATLRF